VDPRHTWQSAHPQQLELQYSLNYEIEQDYAGDVGDLSLYHWDDDSALGGPDVYLVGGYDRIIALLAAGVPIMLGQVVIRIEYGRGDVRVTTGSGVFRAPHAIVTLPLGILREGAVTFSPPLPPRKRLAIGRLHMGVLNKACLRFPRVFWDRDCDQIGYVSAARGHWSEWLNLYKYTGKPILIGFNAATYGLAIERLSDTQTVAAGMTVLRRMYGDHIPVPEAWKITRWASDPFSRGSYSHVPTGARGDDYDARAGPVGDRLHFAGEATTQTYPATVHGAYLTGRRAAREVDGIGS
jgi:monoamine oxidase